MINRPFWSKRLEKAGEEAPIVWLAGVRRSGKTTLAQNPRKGVAELRAFLGSLKREGP